MKKSILVVAVISAFVFGAMSFTAPPPPEVKYKNLKVLSKHTTKAELDSVMRAFTQALGVKCGACHVRNEAEKNWDFASDSNEHKGIARSMMRMTAKINRKYFREDQKEKNQNLIGCYSCHNGKEHPAMKAPAQQGGPGGPGGPPPGGMNGQRPPGGNQTPPTQTPPPNQQ